MASLISALGKSGLENMSIPRIRPTISIKVGGLALLLLIGLFIVGGFSFLQIRSVGAEINVVVKSDLAIKDRIASIERQTGLRRTAANEMANLALQGRMDALRDEFEETNAQSQQVIGDIDAVFDLIATGTAPDNLRPIARYTELFGLMRELEAQNQKIAADTITLAEALLAGENFEAAQTLSRLLSDGDEFTDESLIEIGVSVDQLTQESAASAQDRQRLAATGIVIVAVSALVIGGAMSVFLVRRLTRSVHIVSERAREIEHTIGTDEFVHREIPSVSSDEVGDLAIAFNEMSSNLARNIEVRRQYETDLASARDDAMQANKAKSNFLANMSHELRTPLNAIIGYSEMLEEEAEDLEQEALIPDLKRINVAGRHLLTLINSVLDLSKIEAGQMDVYVEQFDIGEQIEEIVTVIQPLIEKNSNRLEAKIEPNMGLMRADSTKVRQVFLNLLSNAAKFTENGAIRLEASSYSQNGEEFIKATVTDSGIGMTPYQVARIFQEFTQADSSISRRFQGTGLGLTISKHIANLMGGDISVESVEGKGSVFTVVIPRDIEKYVPEEMLSVI